MPLYDWVCEAGHEFSRKAGYETPVLPCDCGLTASRQSVYRINFGGFVPTPVGKQDMREDYRRYREAAQTVEYQKSRLEDATQTRFPDPPLAQIARQEFKKLDAAGVTADQIKT